MDPAVPSKPKNKSYLLIGIVLVILIIIGVSTALFLFQYKKTHVITASNKVPHTSYNLNKGDILVYLRCLPTMNPKTCYLHAENIDDPETDKLLETFYDFPIYIVGEIDKKVFYHSYSYPSSELGFVDLRTGKKTVISNIYQSSKKDYGYIRIAALDPSSQNVLFQETEIKGQEIDPKTSGIVDAGTKNDMLKAYNVKTQQITTILEGPTMGLPDNNMHVLIGERGKTAYVHSIGNYCTDVLTAIDVDTKKAKHVFADNRLIADALVDQQGSQIAFIEKDNSGANFTMSLKLLTLSTGQERTLYSIPNDSYSKDKCTPNDQISLVAFTPRGRELIFTQRHIDTTDVNKVTTTTYVWTPGGFYPEAIAEVASNYYTRVETIWGDDKDTARAGDRLMAYKDHDAYIITNVSIDPGKKEAGIAYISAMANVDQALLIPDNEFDPYNQ